MTSQLRGNFTRLAGPSLACLEKVGLTFGQVLILLVLSPQPAEEEMNLSVGVKEFPRTPGAPGSLSPTVPWLQCAGCLLA